MRIMIVQSVSPLYWREFYRRRPGLAARSYAEQKHVLDHDACGQMGAWESALAPLGHDVASITPNIRPKQAAWARENGTSHSPADWMRITAWEQARSFQPEILIIDDQYLGQPWRERVRSSCPSLRRLLGYWCAPYADARVFEGFDSLLTCSPEFVDGFAKQGIRSHLIAHAFNPEVLERIDPTTEPGAALTFLGAIVRGSGYHLGRERLLEQVARALPIEIYSPSASRGAATDFVETAARRGLYVTARALRDLGVPAAVTARLPGINRAMGWTGMPCHQVNRFLQARMKPPLFGLEMFEALRRSRVTLNTHGDVAAGAAANMRLFEATGVGTCLLTDWKPNLAALFEHDQEVVAYRSPEECVERARWLLEHPRECREIGLAGQRRTLREHTFAHRARRLEEVLSEELAATGNCHGVRGAS